MKKALLSLIALFLTICVQAQSASFSLSSSQVQSCNNDGAASAIITGGVEPYQVYWLQLICNQQGFDTLATGMQISGLAPGYYLAHGYDANGQIGVATLFVQAPFNILPSFTSATCANSDGKIKVTVSNTIGPYTYQWSTGQYTASTNANKDSIENVPAGMYSVTVTNGNGCQASLGGDNPCVGTATSGLFLNSTSPLVVTSTFTPSNCFDGTATVAVTNAQAPISYQWNTVPVQTSSTATGLAPGWYQCLVTDAEGCSRNQFVNVPPGPHFLQVTSSQTPPTCLQSNGEITLNISGGQSPYNVQWSNGASTPSINNLAAGSYSATITDNLGCSLTVHKFLSATSPIQLTLNATAPSCTNNDATATAVATGGQAPYTYAWQNGAATASIAGLAAGTYFVTVTDANGCIKSKWVNNPLPLACFVQVSGRVINDLNGDCTLNGGENGIANVIIKAMPGNYFASTNNTGHYSFLLPPGNYTLEQILPNYFTQVCPGSAGTISINASTAGTSITGNHFFNQPDSIFNDVAVFVTLGPIRPGFGHTAHITVRNLGVTNLIPSLSFTHDPLLQFQNATPAQSSYNVGTNTITFNVPFLVPYATAHFTANYLVDLAAVNQLGEELSATGQVNIIGPDVNLSNNTFVATRLITGSYDPNDKQVWPVGEGEDGRITLDERLFTYKIRFQNTGNDTAFTVIVRDTLDLDLDVSTFKLGAVSHPMEYTISDHGTLAFTFNNILLPDSTTNEPMSHGEINYTIESLPEAGYGTQITNTAAIYFDFNPPIITNTTVNTYYDFTTGILNLDNSTLGVFPNPTLGLVHTKALLEQNALVSLQVTDMQGRVIFRKGQEVWPAGASEHVFPLGQYATQAGVYLMNYTVNSKQYQFKVVLQ